LKIPNFLSIAPRPFNTETYQEDAVATELALIENTIRWRDSKVHGKESNSRMVRWSNGTYSLLVFTEFACVAIF
jgi:hypothetical protein